MKNSYRVLMYHSVGSPRNDETGAKLYRVSVERFREQMRHLAGAIKAGTVSEGDCPCLLTFDDGLLDNYTVAFPILREFGLKAYFFVIVSKIDSVGYISWAQARELKDAGMIIGSHGMTHRILTQLSDKKLNYEIKASRQILEEKLGQRIDYFSVPKGHYNKHVINKIKEAGYKAVFTSDYKNTDGFVFGRIPVKSNWELTYFVRVTNNDPSFRDRVSELMKSSARRLFGAGAYDNLRTHLLKEKVTNL